MLTGIAKVNKESCKNSWIRGYFDLDLVPPVPSGTSGDELSPSGTVAGSISCVTPVYTHRLQIFFQCILPCPHWSSNPPPAASWDPFQSQTSWSGCRESQNVTNKSSSSGRYYATGILDAKPIQYLKMQLYQNVSRVEYRKTEKLKAVVNVATGSHESLTSK